MKPVSIFYLQSPSTTCEEKRVGLPVVLRPQFSALALAPYDAQPYSRDASAMAPCGASAIAPCDATGEVLFSSVLRETVTRNFSPLVGQFAFKGRKHRFTSLPVSDSDKKS